MDQRTSTSSNAKGINDLPPELHFEILSYLTDNITSQISASKVCHLWESIILADSYLQLLRYTPLQTHHSELIAVNQIFNLTEAWVSRPDSITQQPESPAMELRCKIVDEEVIAYHYVPDKNYYAYGKEYNFGPPPCDGEPGVLDISRSTILDEQCIRDISTLPTEEQELNEEVPRLTAPLEELDILTAIHFRGEYYPDVIFAEPVNFLVEGGLTIRQLLENIVSTLIASMKSKSDLDTKKEHYIYLAMRYIREGGCNECWFRTYLCHPDVRISEDGKLLNVVVKDAI
ncbi:hypothetical protein TWF192_001015 [Orbilia oligospora]|uniref:F-box domain-containing protein n=1 Tax=Orbilia oligospora TaxID=2813651 RepID=A0A6G1MHH6_ORBOL|nr:hypothetical protein TWF679_008805 [Orbilia oligospora]KAF3231573.1 hypothetical protein TWF191_005639 [Orbilia oligospora]KAF3257729.1 hypothetical protein TWF192_001015 [Orbilia oligospora]